MQHKKILFWLTISISVILSGLVSYNFAVYWMTRTPIKKITLGRKILLKASQAEAKIYAPALLSEAETLWKTLIEKWHAENKKCLTERDYTEILELSQETIEISEKAITTSQFCKDSIKNDIPAEQLIVKDMINNFKTRYDEIALDQIVSANLVTTELLIYESEYAYQRHEFISALGKIKQAHQLIGQSEDVMSQRLQEYFAQLPDWQNWVKDAIRKSDEDSTLIIIVDKTDKKFRIYDDGKLKFEYPAEFGLKWLGPKKVKGDYSTPEGHYQIREKKEGKKTNYYLALEINYPNPVDEMRFMKAKSQGEVPDDANIGGHIEIHGGGGEGKNWTDGCIALLNKDMENVYQLVEAGTPVVIVGALQSNFTKFK